MPVLTTDIHGPGKPGPCMFIEVVGLIGMVSLEFGVF
jgi:hypothetical protein